MTVRSSYGQARPCDFHPVILGGDIGVYALARSFHEAYACTSTIISGADLGPIKDSAILEVHALGMQSTVDELCEAALELAPYIKEKYQAQHLLLLTNSDSQVRSVVKHKKLLEQHYIVPFVDEELLERLMNKDSFAELCAQFQVNTPKSTVVYVKDYGTSAWIEPPLPGDFPLVAKPANSALYERMHFEGMKKVYKISSAAELDELWQLLKAAEVTSPFILQEMIEGDDQAMRSLTVYIDSQHKLRMCGSARVLLEEHTPSALGNPAAMITEPMPELYRQAQVLLESVHYTGFANFDVKYDAKTQKDYFLEVNPRIGRNNYYNTAAGLNPVKFLVNDVIYHRYDKGGVLHDAPCTCISEKWLYTVVFPHLIRRYVYPETQRELMALVAHNKVVHPLSYARDKGLGFKSLRRRMYIWVSTFKHYQKFKRYYPRPSKDGL